MRAAVRITPNPKASGNANTADAACGWTLAAPSRSISTPLQTPIVLTDLETAPTLQGGRTPHPLFADLGNFLYRQGLGVAASLKAPLAQPATTPQDSLPDIFCGDEASREFLSVTGHRWDSGENALSGFMGKMDS
jgi:hypothetical protein